MGFKLLQIAVVLGGLMLIVSNAQNHFGQITDRGTTNQKILASCSDSAAKRGLTGMEFTAFQNKCFSDAIAITQNKKTP